MYSSGKVRSPPILLHLFRQCLMAAPYSKWRGPKDNPGKLPGEEALTTLLRSLGIDAATAERWGRLTALAGRPVPCVDGLLAATALQHDLVLVTRNVADFSGLGVRLLNPWDVSPA